ncbi:MAG: hypothetical protein COU98_00240 [Candidatus Staskawiczbacteria bacterium CG10_big_fil_rev_8_21_14_0_10_38_10]|uniref:DUF458 domain-containing protein n=1 Tax=Candidatus Staskawiczbacteria bacterium CG10_big_fil_rev_8_21_14_0_10_38_10 TaxID=1974891 RepID=A0A2H9T1Y2_9BACT|nr:MAG: hypothetical protein COU98_00240 [Candidatus Staskawiczbacteria bacterium CG10_big_fil_rev_8_21_14_0_10_38_10]
MSMFKDGNFYSPSKGNLPFEKVIEEIFQYIAERPEKFYEIVVGCDSSSGDKISFPVAIVVLRVGWGGRFFLKKVKYPDSFKKRFSNFHQRILQEVLLSCELALFLKEALNKKMQSLSSRLNYQFRYIHADVGEQGQTRDMIKEVVGLIKSNGFEAKIKPESFAASVVADRYT